MDTPQQMVFTYRGTCNPLGMALRLVFFQMMKDERFPDLPGIYIHFPFCKKKCHYCGFYSTPDMSLYDCYVEAVLRDISLMPRFWEDAKPDIPRPDTLYLGGGTPSLFALSDLEKILSRLKNLSAFEETTIEINPGTISEEKIGHYRKIGIDRVSIGVQSLDDDALRFLGRIHTSSDATKTIEWTARHFDNWGVDIIFGIPGFSAQSLTQNVATLVQKYHPPHISAYALTIEENTPFYRQNITTDENQFCEEFLFLHQYLTSADYLHYELSNYSLPGFASRHNGKYWSRANYLGTGPAAHSLWNEKRFAYDTWQDFRGCDIVTKYNQASSLTNEEIRDEKIMLAMRTSAGIPSSLLDIPESKIQRLIEGRWIERKKNHITATVQGWMVLNRLVMELL